jgi:hypothetical protein
MRKGHGGWVKVGYGVVVVEHETDLVFLPVLLRQSPNKKMNVRFAPTITCRKQICYPDIIPISHDIRDTLNLSLGLLTSSGKKLRTHMSILWYP